MKIAVVGASGNVGSRIVKELLTRGHTVTAIARRPEKITPGNGITIEKGDAYEPLRLAGLLKGHDAVISAVRFLDNDPELLIGAVRASGVKRYLVVGGSASLQVEPGGIWLDSPEFPAQYREEASKGIDFFNLLKTEKELDWVFLCPPALFIPGERTGKFRLGKDHLLWNGKESTISFEDYAIAMVDELEKPAHSRERFSVAY